MRLYAKVKSERGKEIGKGGNDELCISLFVGNAREPREIGQVVLTQRDGEYQLSIFDSEREGTPRVWKEGKM